MSLSLSLGLPLSNIGQLPLGSYLRLKGLEGSTAGADMVRGIYWLPHPGSGLPTRVSEGVFFANYTAAGTTSRTYIAQDGLLKYDLAANQPRYTWINGYRELVLEGSATNWIANSGPVDTGWSRVGSPIVTRDVALAPTGVMAATRWQRTITGPTYAAQVVSKSAATNPFTLSFFARPGVTKCVAARIQGAYPARVDACFNLDTGSVVQSSANGWTGLSASMEPLANGWWRCSLSGTSDAHNAVTAMISPNSGTDAAQRQVDSTDPVASSDVYLYGVQLEAGLAATSYIPTGAAAVTRPIESFQLQSAITSIMQGAEASVVVRSRHRDSRVAGVMFSADDGTLNNRLQLHYGQVGERVITVATGGAAIVNVGTVSPATVAGLYGLAARFKSGDHRLSSNGQAAASAAAGRPTTVLTASRLGRRGWDTTTADSGEYQQLAVFPVALPDARLAALGVPYAA